MIERDPGHHYQLLVLDSTWRSLPQFLRFVKREGPAYPGNVGSYEGTTLQSVLRACCARLDYLQRLEPSVEYFLIREKLITCLWYLEQRAAYRHGLPYPYSRDFARTAPMCETCGHTVCEHRGQP